jgi:membrane-bound lytic murein transglycosylase D
MQPYVRAVLIAAGLLVNPPFSIAADTAPGEPFALRQSTVDATAGWPSAHPPDTVDPQRPPAAELPLIRPPAPAPVSASKAVPTLMDLTAAPTSLWQRIRNGFGLPDMASPLVTEQEEWFAKRPDYIARTVARSSRYLFYIVEQVEKRGMPSEIALLPIIESAYNPVAYSRAHASGIWQFIPSTGKLYGLQQNFWYDGRRDVMAATNAALDYLEKLYEMFGSWDLALASYNWGEGAVSRAITKNMAKGLATDYRSLSMPTETRYYIPKLQAIKNIIANPAQYGIDLAEVPNQPYFVAVTTTRHIDVKLAAKFADMQLEDFKSLNPGNSRPVIKADGERTLLIPTDKAGTFLSKLEAHDEPLVSWQAYKLKTGETLERVAARYGIDTAQLKHVNGIGARRVGAGATLLVPSGGSATPYLPDMPAPPVSVAKAPRKGGKNVSAARRQTHARRKGGGAVKTAHAWKAVRKRAAPPTRQATAASSPKKIALAQKTR